MSVAKPLEPASDRATALARCGLNMAGLLGGVDYYGCESGMMDVVDENKYDGRRKRTRVVDQ